MSNKTYSADEIEKFNQQSNDWWDVDGPFKTLHHINTTRLDFILKQVDLRQKNILDIGCGGGILSESLVKHGGTVLGIDLAEQAIAQAQTHQQWLAPQLQPHLRYQCIDSGELAQQCPAHFDIICCMELLEHVPAPEELLVHCSQMLKPQGALFLATINRNLQSFFYAIVCAEYLMNLLPKGTHNFDQFIKPSELRTALQNTGFTLKCIAGLHYNPFTKVASLAQNVSTNYLMYAEKV